MFIGKLKWHMSIDCKNIGKGLWLTGCLTYRLRKSDFIIKCIVLVFCVSRDVW